MINADPARYELMGFGCPYFDVTTQKLRTYSKSRVNESAFGLGLLKGDDSEADAAHQYVDITGFRCKSLP